MFKILFLSSFLFLSSCDVLYKKYYSFYPSDTRKILISLKNKNLSEAKKNAIDSYTKRPLFFISYFNLAYVISQESYLKNFEGDKAKIFNLSSSLYLYILNLIEKENKNLPLIQFFSFFNLATLNQNNQKLKKALYFYQKSLSIPEVGPSRRKQVKINIELLFKNKENKENQKSKENKENKGNQKSKESKKREGNKDKDKDFKNQDKNKKNKDLKGDNKKSKEESKTEQVENKNKVKEKKQDLTIKKRKIKENSILNKKNIEQILKNIRLQEQHVYEEIQNKNQEKGGLNGKDW